MTSFQTYVGKSIAVTLSGELTIYGVLLEKGLDLLVLYDNEDYVYLPLLHIQRISPELPHDITTQLSSLESQEMTKEELPIVVDTSLSLRKILQNSKGLFTEIFVTNNQTLHGYVTHIMNNYFVFYSPVYKTMYIPFQHVKWIIPYPANKTPYDLTKESLPLQPSSGPLARTFEEQLKKLVGKIIVFDLGQQQVKIGKFIQMQDNFAELSVARNEIVHLHLSHIKTVHCP